MRALCILFLPFRCEKKDIHLSDIESLYHENEDRIEEIRQQFEKHRGLVEKIQSVEEERSDELEDNLESDDEFIEDETTEPAKIKEFEKLAQDQAKRVINSHNAGIHRMESDEYQHLLGSLNEEQGRLFNDFCERMLDASSEPFYCYVSGEAGTGKSFLLRLMIEFVNRLPKSSGQELDKPVQITLAPTGVAAFIVHGTTIESGLGLQPNNRKSHISNNASRNADLQFLYQDLRVIFIDEISMVGSDQLARINFRLQEIMGNTKFFGGVACVCTGDFGQLPPVKQSMIWETSHIDGRPDLAPNHWDEFFKIAYLRQKMRSEDSNFSNICDKVRVGTVDNHVSEFMKSCVRNCPFENNNEEYANGKLCIIVTNNKDRNRINEEMLSNLLPDKKSFIVSASDSSTNVRNPPKLDENLPLTVTGQLEHTITFKEGTIINNFLL